MGNLTITEIGSIILNMIEDVPTNISGVLPTLISNEIYFAECHTSHSIGENVGEPYQPAIISLSTSQVVRLMQMEGADVNSIKLGDFTVNKGGESSQVVTSEGLREDGLTKLNCLGAGTSYYRTY